jgi:hypothetical protein
MIANGTIVEVYEDPLTMQRKEGNAKILEHVLELDPGVDQYKVNFVGDDEEMFVVRTIVSKPTCCCYEIVGDNDQCKVHAKHLEMQNERKVC